VIPASVIRAKRDGEELSREDIDGFIRGFLDWEVTSYQMSAFLMAVTLRGMTARETADLTRVMLETGEKLTFPGSAARAVDKHSTGGVGDLVSIPLAPLVAAAGVPVPMMAGRGLGHTGGTIDKLESIPGFRADLDPAGFRRMIAEVGCAIGEQTLAVAPADRRMYALRDVTATVESIPLIVSSILSKKGAEGIDALVLDVKCGRGAFMKSEESALRLARTLAEVGGILGLETVAFVTDMDRPLGNSVGNAIEVREALDVLAGRGSEDLTGLVLDLGAAMLALGRPGTGFEENRVRLRGLLDDGSGLARFRKLVSAQGGDAGALDDPERGLPLAPVRIDVPAPDDGWVSDLEPVALGRAAAELGGGRRAAGDAIDPGVGIRIARGVGARVRRGDVLAVIHCREREAGERAARESIAPAFRIAADRPVVPPVIRHLVTAAGAVPWEGPRTWDQAVSAPGGGGAKTKSERMAVKR
jgi:pyrimidine-nucleoside phosphorylase